MKKTSFLEKEEENNIYFVRSRTNRRTDNYEERD